MRPPSPPSAAATSRDCWGWDRSSYRGLSPEGTAPGPYFTRDDAPRVTLKEMNFTQTSTQQLANKGVALGRVRLQASDRIQATVEGKFFELPRHALPFAIS